MACFVFVFEALSDSSFLRRCIGARLSFQKSHVTEVRDMNLSKLVADDVMSTAA